MYQYILVLSTSIQKHGIWQIKKGKTLRFSTKYTHLLICFSKIYFVFNNKQAKTSYKIHIFL